MRKNTFILLFVLLLSFLPFQKSFALSCIEPPPPEVAFHQYDVVVIATVTSTKNQLFFDTKSITADVSISLKGYNGNTITFIEDKTWGRSQVGTEYLLFLNKKGDGLESPLCSPTTETIGLNRDNIIKTLVAEANTIQEEVIYTPDESSFSWGWVLLISLIFVIITALIFHKSRVKNTD